MSNVYIFEKLLKFSLNNNVRYIHRYVNYIEYCKKTSVSSKYTEKHHIIPRSFGGSDLTDNLIELSARQHYIAHILLAKATNHPKMIKALHKMVYSTTGDVQRNYRVSSKVYEFLRSEHAKIVSSYSKNTVVARQIYTDEIKRIPKNLFHYYNGVLYESPRKGKTDTIETRIKKQQASKKPRNVRQKLRSRAVAATLYSYQTPKGFCETRQDIFELYPTFTRNTLIVVNKDAIISNKFVSIHTEFKDYVGRKFSEIGFIKINRKNNE